MRFTYRLAWLVAAGVPPLMLMGLLPALGPIVLLYDIVLAAMVLSDIIATPRPETVLTVDRYVDEKLSMGVPNVVVLEARNRAAYPLAVRVRDEPPYQFDLDGEAEQVVNLPSGNAPVHVRYHVQPPAKGDFTFGDMFVQYSGRLGLIMRQARFSAGRMVKVYPNLLETQKYEMLARRGRLQQVGIRSARIRGGGSEFESLRDYVPGDEFKKIDWSATARRGKLITRQYEAERSQNVMILLDTGRTMLQPVQKMAKLDFVINTALMLAYVASVSDDKIGMMAFDADVRAFLPPAKSKAQVYHIVENLYNLDARLVESDYRESFEYLASRWRRRSLVVLFTDLVDPESSSQILDAVPILEDRHRVVCVTVSDPNIIGASRIDPAVADDVYRKAVAQQVLHERRQAISTLRHRGVWTIDSPPEELSADLVNHYLDLKARSLI
jgi:uncharacterized protein (DUF58 family)